MTKDKIMRNIRSTSMFFLSGILGIIAFFNTAAIEQAKLLGMVDAELNAVVDGINHSSFILLIVCIFFFTSLLPIEEVVHSIIPKKVNVPVPIMAQPNSSEPKSTSPKKMDVYLLISSISFVIGFLSFTVLFIIYTINFIPLL